MCQSVLPSDSEGSEEIKRVSGVVSIVVSRRLKDKIYGDICSSFSSFINL